MKYFFSRAEKPKLAFLLNCSKAPNLDVFNASGDSLKLQKMQKCETEFAQ